MAIGTRTKEIGGITYEVQQHPARRAMRLLPRLGKLVGPLVVGHLLSPELSEHGLT